MSRRRKQQQQKQKQAPDTRNTLWRLTFQAQRRWVIPRLQGSALPSSAFWVQARIALSSLLQRWGLPQRVVESTMWKLCPEEMFTVRRIVAGEGVERKFPLHSPRVEKVEVKRSSVVRRAKLYFLRERVGKAVRLKERRRK